MDNQPKKGIVVIFSTDTALFRGESAVLARMKEYATLFRETHVVVLTTQRMAQENIKRGAGLPIAENALLYSTYSKNKLSAMNDAYHIGQSIIESFKKRAGIGQPLIQEVVIVTQDPFETGWIGARLQKEYNCGLHVQVHTDFLSPYFFKPFFSKSGFLNRIRRIIARRIIRQAHSIRVVSERVADSLVKKWKVPRTNITVLPIQFDFTKEQMNEVCNSKDQERWSHFTSRIITVCRLEAEKNLFSMMRIIKLVNEKKPGTGLVVVGDGSLLVSLQRYAKAIGVANSVVFVGQNNPIPYYRIADLYLCNSFYEGYGLSLAEAAFMGVPMVSTPVGIMGTLLRDGKEAALFEQGDEESASEYISVLLTDPTLRRKYAEAAHVAVSAIILSKTEYLQRFERSVLAALHR